MHTALGEGAEFDRIRGIWRRIGRVGASLGDDCAVLDLGGSRVAISTDLSVEGTHFERGWLALDELGWRATTAALSDLAAMAAEPRGVLVSLGISAEMPDDWAAEIMQGAADAAAAVGTNIIGGDLVRSDRILIDVAVIGALSGAPVTRDAAQAGDQLFVTGLLGGPAVAVEAWRERREPEATARERFVHPVARIREAQWLRDRGVTAMIDLSDGLYADAGNIAAASDVACVLKVKSLPVHAACAGVEAALFSGEEYELLVAIPPEHAEDIASEFHALFHLPLTRVGDVEVGHGVALKHVAGLELDIRTFQHF
jgi:thiamine-monophosphate kinase